MSTATSYSKLGYMILKKESTAGVAVTPDVPIELLAESVAVNWDFSAVSPIAGSRSKNIKTVANQVGPFDGSVELYCEPNSVGYFLVALFGEDVATTLEAATVYQHDFEPLNTLQTLTMDIKVAGESYIRRFFGVRISKITLSKDDNKIKMVVDISAQRVFDCARATAVYANGTVLDLDQSSGITTSDTLLVLDEANLDTVNNILTVSAVVSETRLTVSALGAAVAVDDVIVIQAQTIDGDDYEISKEFIWAGGADVYIGTTENPMQQLAAKTNVEDFEIVIENEIEPRWSATGVDVVDRMPANMLLKGVSATGKFTQFHTNPEFIDCLRSNEQIGLRFNFWGPSISSDVAAAASGTIETDGVGTVSVTVDAAGEAGNDYAIIVEQGAAALSASLSGKLITVTLAAIAGSNTTTLVAGVIDALSGVSCVSAGADLVTVVDNPDKIFFAAGRDAAERSLLRFDFPNVRLNVFTPNLSAEEIVNEEIPFTAYRDSNDEREVFCRLRNAIATY